MARIKPGDRTGEVADRLRQRRNGSLTPLDDVLLHSPPLADGWNTLIGAVRGDLLLPGDLRELTILRVAALNGAEYEWQAHEPVARQEGLSKTQIDSLRLNLDQMSAVMSAIQRLCVQYTDAMTRELEVPEPLFRQILAQLGERQTVELTATIAAYNLVSRFLLAMGIEGGDYARGTK